MDICKIGRITVQFSLALWWQDTALYLILVPEEVNKLQTTEEREKNEEEVKKRAMLRNGVRKGFD